MNNPFHFGQVVEGEAYSPRTRVEKKLRGRIAQRQNTTLIGERRVGKTSLIHRVVSKLRGKRHFYADFLGIKTGEDFLKRCIFGLEPLYRQAPLMERLVRSLPGVSVSMSQDPVTGLPTVSPSFAPGGYRAENLGGLFDLFAELDRGGKLIVTFDEFQDVGKLPDAEAVLAVLRSRVQFLGNLPFVFSGSVRGEMWRLFADPESAFFKSTEIVEVTAADFDDFEKFLRERFEAGRRRVSEELLGRVMEICDRVPGDAQQLCAALWETSQNRDRLEVDRLPGAMDEIFRNELRGYEIWLNELSAQQMKVLGAVARLGGESVLAKEFLRETGIAHASSVKAALTRLVNRGVLFRTGEEYRFVNPFFRAWMLSKGY